MPKITVRVSDVDYHAARIWAAAHGTTVTDAVTRFLQNLPARQEDLPALISSLSEHLSIPASRLKNYMLTPDFEDLKSMPGLDSEDFALED